MMANLQKLIFQGILLMIPIPTGVCVAEDQPVKHTVTIGPREKVSPPSVIPGEIMDSSLATLRKDEKTWHFYHSSHWGEANEKFIGDATNPFQTLVWRKSRDEMYDLNGWYKDVHHVGIWLHNIYRMEDGNLLGVAHVELHHKEPGVNQGENYAIGLVFSTDGGNRWTYCGEIVRPHNSNYNIGGTPFLVVGEFFHVYFNDHGPNTSGAYEAPDGRRLAVARANMKEVLAAARNNTVTPWHKYRDGTWSEDGLKGLGSAVLPSRPIQGGASAHPADLHADGAFNKTAGIYMITRWYYAEGVGKLYLHTSSNGVDFDKTHLLDEEPGQWMPYSTFMADTRDQETKDALALGDEFHILINHKSAESYNKDSLYRRKISIKR